MATRTLPRQHSHAHDNARQRADRKRAHTKWLWLAIGAFVVAAAGIAVFSTSTSPAKTGTGVEQARPAQITGTALPELASGSDAAIGQTIPEVAGASFDGTPVSITHDGRPKLVLFVAHWCPHCQKEVPLIVSHLNQKALAAGVDLIAVSTSASANKPNYPPSQWLANEDWRWPVIADSTDGTAALAYGLTGFPYFVAADASGKVVGRSSGEISMNDFDALVQKALSPVAG